MVKASPEKRASPKKNNPKGKSPISKQKQNPIVKQKQKINKKVLKPAVPKQQIEKNGAKQKQNKKEEVSEDTIVEYFGQQVSRADKKKMEPIVGAMRSKASKPDLKNFVANYSQFLTEGTLVLGRFKKWKCIICLKYGHPRDVCPKRWKDGKRIAVCYVCKEGGLPHPQCKRDNLCYYCNQEGHISKDCPDEKKPLGEENQKTPGGTKKNNRRNNKQKKEDENKPAEKENANKPAEKESGNKPATKKRGKNNDKRPLEENKEEPVSSPKKNKKNKAK